MAVIILLMQRFWFIAKVPWIFFMIYGLCIIAMIQGRIKVDLYKAKLFLLMVTLSLVSTLVIWHQQHYADLASSIYFIAIYALFTLTPNRQGVEERNLLHAWQLLSGFCAILGIVQFFVYLLFGAVIDIGLILPSSIGATSGYNIIDTTIGHHIIRANGVLFLEPSFFSQFMALALIIELVYFRRKVYLIILMLGILCSLSGTGILMILITGIASMFLYPKQLLRLPTWIGIGTLVFIALVIARVPSLNTYFLSRIHHVIDFHNYNTSFSQRFITPWLNIWHIMELNWQNNLFGIGAGWQHLVNMIPPRHSHSRLFIANYNPLTQLIAYYGLPTMFCFMVFILQSAVKKHASKPNILIMITILVQYFFCSGALLTPNISYVLLWFIFLYASTHHAQDCTR